jgi:hypothetical protein
VIVMTRSGFIIDGADRLFAILLQQFREEVEAEFAERFAVASWFERWRLRREVAREVKRRIRSAVSDQTLF